MKYTINLLLVLVFSLQFLYAQKDGAFIDYYDSGELKTEGHYKNKKRIGNWTSYYKSGQISSLYSYTDGKRDVEYIAYHKNGKLKVKTQIENGKSISRGYYESGELYSEREVKTGYYKSYTKNGKLKIEANYDNYELSGEWKQYYENGEVEWLVNYKDGYRHGVYKQFYNNGIIKLEGSNKKNKKEGEEKRYLQNNILEWKGYYSKDKLSKTWVKFNDEGEKLEKIKFKNGKALNIETSKGLVSTKIPEGVTEKVPIYPGCEDRITNRTLKKCMSNQISQLILTNFNKDYISNIGLKKGKQRIYAMFKIDKEGVVKDIKVRASHTLLQVEVHRVLKLLPKLKPGFQRGKPVIVPFSIPIVFMVK